MKALIIVAHPDDETIWMGCTILRHKDWNWTILSLCRSEDSDRKPRFEEACNHFNAKGIISNLEDETLIPLTQEEIINKIENLLSEKKYDYIFTHGDNGEYGHIRHKEVHQAIKKMISENELSCKRLFYFAYEKDKDTCKPRSIANEKFILSKNELKEKQKMITEIYNFPKGGFEQITCLMPVEAFFVERK